MSLGNSPRSINPKEVEDPFGEVGPSPTQLRQKVPVLVIRIQAQDFVGPAFHGTGMDRCVRLAAADDWY